MCMKIKGSVGAFQVRTHAHTEYENYLFSSVTTYETIKYAEHDCFVLYLREIYDFNWQTE